MTADEALLVEGHRRPRRPRQRRLVGNIVPAVWIVLVVASVSLLLARLQTQYRPDREMNDSTKQSAIDAATEGAVAVLTYSSGNFDRDDRPPGPS